MPLMKFRLPLLLCLLVNTAFGQSILPQDYFKNPMKIPIYLAGNFGELRNNHFHSGIDIKTKQRTGLSVMASADGYVSRIKVRPYGYGKVLYIQHPNGYTTVYGHLQEFAPEIRAYVREKMYAREKNEISLYPDKGALPVKQGEVIALSGESGGAAGPHLHFEIRDGLQRPMNPLLFGLKVEDHRPPRIYGLYVYPQGTNAHVNKSARRQRLNLIKQKDGSYITPTIQAYGKLGFGVYTRDYMDRTSNYFNVYRIKTCLNGEDRFEIIFNKFSFAKTRYINRYIDYAYYETKDQRIQKLFLQPNNEIDAQLETTNKGYIDIADSLNYKYKIILEDYAGNRTLIRVPIIAHKIDHKDIQAKEIDTTAYYAYANQANVFNLKYHDVYIPKGALYENTYLNIVDHPHKVKVHRDIVPLQKYITIGFDASKYAKEDRAKLYVARTYPWGTSYYSNTYKDGTRITTRTRTFGTFKLAMDNQPPTVTPVNFHNKDWVSNLDYLKVKIEDAETDVASYRGTINGKFIVMLFNHKNNTISYDFRDNISDETENKLKIIVVDEVGNSTTFESTFYRKD